ncbi:hypothetical protein SASPL_143348 [Salvia splendens]|uniref:Uncharacterized protein n=1 Tax=Salvia splendens TaxID=180675 RepID=A0A8X8ZA82_SALSN|nr:hypothetical protein SASPL_143348 [Salvia splendens]
MVFAKKKNIFKNNPHLLTLYSSPPHCFWFEKLKLLFWMKATNDTGQATRDLRGNQLQRKFSRTKLEVGRSFFLLGLLQLSRFHRRSRENNPRCLFRRLARITISDTTLEAEFDDTMRSGKAHVTGQSSAAAGKQKGKMNPRKLFDDVGNDSDRESTNGKGTRSSNDTSCASSSPNAWWRRPYE